MSSHSSAKPAHPHPAAGAGRPAGSSRVDVRTLLRDMKLGGKNDAHMYNALKTWVDSLGDMGAVVPVYFPTSKAEACRTTSTMLLIRLFRAFEQRVDPNEVKKRTSSGGGAASAGGGDSTASATKGDKAPAPGPESADAKATKVPEAGENKPVDPNPSTTATLTTIPAPGALKTVETTAAVNEQRVKETQKVKPGTGTATSTSTGKPPAPAAHPKSTAPVLTPIPLAPNNMPATVAALKPHATLAELMKRRVKVTRAVQQAVQFLGSDVLKVLQVTPQAPTVAEVADCCLLILKDVNNITECYKTYCTANNTAPHSHGKDGTKAIPVVIDATSPIYFGVFALQCLQTIRAQSVSTCELSYDFDYIYNACYIKDASFKASLDVLNPVLAAGSASAFAPDTEARNVCWKLARVMALKESFTKGSLGSNQVDGGWASQRRKHVISSAAAIVLTAELGRLHQAASSGSAAAAGSAGPAASNKRQKVGPNDVSDIVDLVTGATTELMNFVKQNTYRVEKDKVLVTRAEITVKVAELARMMISVPWIPQPVVWQHTSDINSNVSLRNLDPNKQNFVLQNYREIISATVAELQRSLHLQVTLPASGSSPSKHAKGSGPPIRSPIAIVLFLFPMVIGEPWGIHRDAPTITTKQLCAFTTRKPQAVAKNSVAVVLMAKSNPSAPAVTTGASMKRPATGPVLAPAPVAKRAATATKRIATPPQPRLPKVVKMTEVDPPVIDDSLELNEWTLSILSMSLIKPSDTLLTFLGEHDRRRGDGSTCLHDVIVPVLNRGISRIHKTIQMAHSPDPAASSTQISIGRRDGQVYVNGRVNEDIQLCASVVGFFYHCLEAVMNDQLQRLEFLGPFNALMQSESFHRALLALCYTCVLKGVGATQKLLIDGSYKDCTVYLLMETIESNPYTFLKVAEALRRALVVTDESPKGKSGSPIVPRLPAILHQHVQRIEVQLLDSIIWASSMPATKSESSVFVVIKSMKSLPGAWPPDVLAPVLPEELFDLENEAAKLREIRFKPTFSASSEANFLTYVLRKLMKLAFHRIQEIFAALDMSSDALVHTQVFVAFRYLMRHHIELFFERHMDQLLLCTIYGVCKVLNVKPQTTFGQIMDAYFAIRGDELGQRTTRVIVRHVKLTLPENGVRSDGKFFGNLITFFNEVYVPKMKKHFLNSKSLKKSSSEYRKLRVLQEQRVGSNAGSTRPGVATTHAALSRTIQPVKRKPMDPSSLSSAKPAAASKTGSSSVNHGRSAVVTKPIGMPLQGPPTAKAAAPATAVAGVKAAPSGTSQPTVSEKATDKPIVDVEMIDANAPELETVDQPSGFAAGTATEKSIPNPKVTVATKVGDKDINIQVAVGRAIPSTVPAEVGAQNRTFSSMGGADQEGS